MPWMTADDVTTRRPGISDATDGAIEALIAEFEQLAERYLGVSYLTREAVHTGFPVDGVLELPHLQVVSVESLVDENDTAVTYKLNKRRGTIYDLRHHGELTAEYTHGLNAPTPRLLGACARWVERMIVVDRTGTSRDVLSQSFESGTTRYSTPDWAAGRPTGFLQIDADLNAERSYLLQVG
jgi:hypothetical protein